MTRRVKARTERRSKTELNWHGLVFDELANGQAVKHYSKHRLTASVTYVTMTCELTNNQWACLVYPLVSSSKTKPCQFSYVALYAL